MDFLIFTVVCVVVLLLGRHRLARSSLDWRSLGGFVCGASLGLLFGRIVADDAVELVKATGVSWPVFRLLFIVIGGVAGAAGFREVLEQAFPPGRKERRNNDAAGQR